jgi:hypothetical protein
MAGSQGAGAEIAVYGRPEAVNEPFSIKCYCGRIAAAGSGNAGNKALFLVPNAV